MLMSCLFFVLFLLFGQPVAANKTVVGPVNDKSDRVRRVRGGAGGGGALGTLFRAFDPLRWSFPRPVRKHAVNDPKTPTRVEQGCLQVVVAIAMPCPRRTWCIAEKVEDVPASEWADDRLVYSIGLLEVPWRKSASGLDDG